MSVKLTQPLPPFRIDDAVLERLWRTLEAKWTGEKPSSSKLTVCERTRGAAGRAREEHRHAYQSVKELQRATSGSGLLREYTLSVYSWGDDSRGVSLYAPGGGGAATIEVEGAHAEWCREVLDTVLNLLRPHTVWYAMVHRHGLGTPIWAALVLGAAWIVASWFLPRWLPLVMALYLPLLAMILFRERLFPAADIRVRGREAQPVAGGGGEGDRGHRDRHSAPTRDLGVDSREPPARTGGEPARKDSEGVVVLSDHRRVKRSEGTNTTSR